MKKMISRRSFLAAAGVSAAALALTACGGSADVYKRQTLGIAAAFGVFWFGLTVWLMRNKLNLE